MFVAGEKLSHADQKLCESFSVCLEQTRADNQRVVVMAKWENARLAGVYIQTFIVRVK
jgi:hypothetical protein